MKSSCWVAVKFENAANVSFLGNVVKKGYGSVSGFIIEPVLTVDLLIVIDFKTFVNAPWKFFRFNG